MATAASPCNLFLSGDTTKLRQCTKHALTMLSTNNTVSMPTLKGCCSSELFIAQTNDAGAAADFEGSKI